MRIALVGTYSSLNKGDFAMHQALIKEISKRIVECEFDIFSPYPELDKIRYSQYFDSDLNISIKRDSLRNSFTILSSTLFSYIGKSNLFDKYDVIIDVSGDTMGEGYSVKNTIFKILCLNIYTNIHTKMILSPQSFGPFTYSKIFFRKFFGRVKKIYARDPLSYKYLEELKLKNICLTGDLAFLLGKYENKSNKQYLDLIRNMEGTKIGLNLSFLIKKYFPDKNIDIVEFGTKLCNRLYSKFDDASIIFIPHVFGPEENKNDSKIGELIYCNLSDISKNKFIFIDHEMNHEEIKAIISETGIFIGARMHACIGAMSTGTPFVNISYSNKSIGLISQYFGLQNSCVDIRNMKSETEIIDRILANVEEVLNDVENIKKILIHKSEELKKKSSESIDEICEIIQK